MELNRRQFVKTAGVVLSGLVLLPCLPGCQPESLAFGWVTDIHYVLARPCWNRIYAEGMVKLNEAIRLFNEKNVDFTIETGDFKDQNKTDQPARSMAYLKAIESCFAGFKGPRYHVLGNHDLDSLSKEQFAQVSPNSGIDKGSTYYSFVKKGYRCVVLDACYRSDGIPYDSNNFHWKDCFIPQEQLDWLKQELERSHEPVLVFVHQLLDGKGDLYVNNAAQVRAVLEAAQKVVAVFQGHKHIGDYKVINGIHYVTQRAMVEGYAPEGNSYSIVVIDANDIHMQGYRRMVTMDFQLWENVLM